VRKIYQFRIFERKRRGFVRAVCGKATTARESERERTLRFCKIYLSKACAESVLSIILSNFFSRSDVDIRLKIFFSFSLPFARASSLVKHLC